MEKRKEKLVYKLLRIKDGKLYPLYIDSNTEIPMNQWVKAIAGPKTEDGKVQSNRWKLAYRPGFHCTKIPLADHIGKKQPDGKLYQSKDTVWCEVYLCSNYDYTFIASKMGKSKRDQCLTVLPRDGYYVYKTNPNAKVDWYITSHIKVTKILSHEEVEKICKDHGYEAQPLEN